MFTPISPHINRRLITQRLRCSIAKCRHIAKKSKVVTHHFMLSSREIISGTACKHHTAQQSTDSHSMTLTAHLPLSKIGMLNSFLQRVSIACYAKRCISYRKSVRLSVCLSVRLSVRHTLALCQNDSSYDHGVFTGG